MRHLTRLYFENNSSVEQFVSIVDQGVERVAQDPNPPIFNPLYNIKVGSFSNPMTLAEAKDALQFLQFTPCFFKLPVGAHAIVDIYIPDLSGSTDPKVFDYQVFKAKKPEHVMDSAKEVTAFRERLKKIPAEAFHVSSNHPHKGAVGPAGPTGPTAGTGPTGPTASICCYSSSGPSGPSNPCGGQTSIPCPDPIFTRASCVNGTLQCVNSEPPGKDKKKSN